MTARGLEDVRVVELTRDLAAAFCAREFALWGAAVRRVRLQGRPPSHWRPAVRTERGEVSLLWEFLDAAKQPVETPEGDLPGLLRELLPAADVFVTDWSPADLQRAGFDPGQIAAAYPRLVLVHVRPFGLEGPYAALEEVDLLVQALSGFMSVNGEAAGPPLRGPANVLAYGVGVDAFLGGLAALWERQSSGAGQAVEVSGIEAAASFVRFLRTEYIGWPEPRHGGAGPPAFRCADGFVTANVASPDLWEKVLAALDGDPDAVRGRVLGPGGAPAPARIAEVMREHLLTQPARYVFEVCNRLQISGGLVADPAGLLDDPHLAAREYFTPSERPGLGKVVLPQRPFRHELSPPAAPVALPSRSPGSTAAPLAGVRVLDFAQAWMGPFACMHLGDLGADVIKVESPKRPDVWRLLQSSTAPKGDPHWPVPRDPDAHPWNTNHLFNSTNRSKRAITLNLADERAKQVFERLVASVDVMVTNYTPRVLENFGFTPANLWKLNPSLVVVDVSGYGRNGPYRDFKANGATIEASAGWMSLFAPPHSPPFSLGAWQTDAFCGARMAAVALVGLLGRSRDSRGRAFESSMQEIAIDYIGEEILNASAGGVTITRRGNHHLDFAPHGAYPCGGENRWIAIVIRDDADWRALLGQVPEASALHDAAYATAQGRRANVDALDGELARWTAGHDRDGLARALQFAGVPAAPVLELDEVLHDPAFVGRDWFRPVTHPDLGEHRYNGFPWRFGRTPARVSAPPPRLGEHSHDVITGELGFDEAEYRALVDAGLSGPTLGRAT